VPWRWGDSEVGHSAARRAPGRGGAIEERGSMVMGCGVRVTWGDGARRAGRGVVARAPPVGERER
jgi:hypothetical protein